MQRKIISDLGCWCGRPAGGWWCRHNSYAHLNIMLYIYSTVFYSPGKASLVSILETSSYYVLSHVTAAASDCDDTSLPEAIVQRPEEDQRSIAMGAPLFFSGPTDFAVNPHLIYNKIQNNWVLLQILTSSLQSIKKICNKSTTNLHQKLACCRLKNLHCRPMSM